MVQLPSELVTTVCPRPPLPVVVTLDETLPSPELIVTELPPLECPVTLPPPAVTELDRVPELSAWLASRSTILQFLLSSAANTGVAIRTAKAEARASWTVRCEDMSHSSNCCVTGSAAEPALISADSHRLGPP